MPKRKTCSYPQHPAFPHTPANSVRATLPLDTNLDTELIISTAAAVVPIHVPCHLVCYFHGPASALSPLFSVTLAK